MFTVKFVGGAKKSFPKEQLKIDKSDISIQDLIGLLVELKPDDSPKLDTDNVGRIISYGWKIHKNQR